MPRSCRREKAARQGPRRARGRGESGPGFGRLWDCALNYCAADWHTRVVLDDGFYDSTVGTCPNGHRHLVDHEPDD